MLPKDARHAHVMPGLSGHALVSIAQLCNHGCIVHFDKAQCHIMYKGKRVLTGLRDPRTRLWHILLCPNPNRQEHLSHEVPHEHSAHNVYETSTQSDLVQYLHQCCFSPTPSTFKQAINNNNLMSFPGLTAHAFANIFLNLFHKQY